jgi:hypothetical protein
MNISNDRFSTTVKTIADKTDWNDHNDALILGAQLLQNDRLLRHFKRIQRCHKKIRYMPYKLNKLRYGLYIELLQQAESELTAEQFNVFRRSFLTGGIYAKR